MSATDTPGAPGAPDAPDAPDTRARKGPMMRVLDVIERTGNRIPHPFWLFNPWFEPTVNYTVSFLDKVFQR